MVVAYKGGVLHFVEVKTRSSEILSSPFDAIDNDKMVHIYSAIQHYFRYFRLSDSYPWVFDAVGVVYENENKYSIDFREDVGVYLYERSGGIFPSIWVRGNRRGAWGFFHGAPRGGRRVRNDENCASAL